MGSPLGPLMANVFMCHLEEKLSRVGLIPDLYKRYVDDTLAKMPSTEAASLFLTTLNGLHPSMEFSMELPVSDKIPFIGIEIAKSGTKLELKFTGNQQTLACSYISTVTLINVTKTLY